MYKELKTEIEEVVKALKTSGRVHLARQIEENWDKTCLKYSKKLNDYSPDMPTEPELIEAFDEELVRLGYGTEIRKKIILSLEKNRIIQTSPHLVATEGPKMFCINWLGSLGVQKKDFYIVGAFSGNPFSNITHPGRIPTKNKEYNLIPSKMQDVLVYRSKIPEELDEKVKELPQNIKKFLPKTFPGSSYTKWALKLCQSMVKNALGKENIVYVDINEVVANYLTKVLKNNSHVFYKILFDQEIRKQIISEFPDEIMFYAPFQNGKYEETESFFLSEKCLVNKKREISLENPDVVINEIKNGRLCPALFLTFTALSFVNRFKCFGSFAQVEYLPKYQRKISDISFMKKFQVEKIPTSSLTVGVFPGNGSIFPVDLVIQNEKLKQNEKMLFGELIVGMKDRLISNYLKTKDNKHDKK